MRHNEITVFRSMYSYFERKKLCENKGKLIKQEKVETDEKETVSEMEFRKIMQHIKAATTRAVSSKAIFEAVQKRIML